MLPSTWIALLLFLLTVSPGVFFELLGARRRVGTVESSLREIGRVVLGSLAFTGTAVVLLSLFGAAVPAALPAPRELILGGTAYLADHYRLVLAAITAEAVLAHALVAVTHAVLAKRRGRGTLRPVSAWSRVFGEDVPDDHIVFARVRLQDGLVYAGQVAHYTADLPLADRELVLAPPLASKTGDNPLTPLPASYQRVVVRGADMKVLAVEYRAIKPAGPQ
jgi:hypothetical protein